MVVGDQLWIQHSKLNELDNYKGELLAGNYAVLIWWNRRGFFLFCQLPDSYLGLEIFMNVDQFIIVY